jgi:hypothetical protein
MFSSPRRGVQHAYGGHEVIGQVGREITLGEGVGEAWDLDRYRLCLHGAE